MVYLYQYHIDIGDTSTVKESLEQAIEPARGVFVQVLEELKQYAPDAESVIVEYVDKDGNIIYSKEFK